MQNGFIKAIYSGHSTHRFFCGLLTVAEPSPGFKHQLLGCSRRIVPPPCPHLVLRHPFHLLPRLSAKQESQLNKILHNSSARCPRTAQVTNPRDARRKTPDVKLPFPVLSESELRAVFGQSVSSYEGNKVLEVLQRRRVTGSLVDLGVGLKNCHVAEPECMNALRWLRKNHPIDEEGAAAKWAALRAAKLEEDLGGKKSELRDYARPEDSEDPTSVEWKMRHSVAAEMLQKSKEDKEKNVKEGKLKDEEQRTERMQKSKELRVAKEEAEKQRGLKTQELKRRRDDLYRKSRILEQDHPPDMSNWQRLGPSTVFATAFIAICYLGAEYHTPPAQCDRIFGGLRLSIATFIGILIPCVMVTLLWHPVQIASMSQILNKLFFSSPKSADAVGALWRSLNKYFVLSVGYPYVLSLVGQTFSHQRFAHLMVNMIGLSIYGIELHEEVGRGNFMLMYLGGGVTGAMFTLWHSVLQRRWDVNSMGASGAVYALAAAWAYVTATKPAKSTEDLSFSFDVLRYAILLMQLPLHFMRSVWKETDVLGHAGGVVFGLVTAYVWKRAHPECHEEREGNRVDRRA